MALCRCVALRCGYWNPVKGTYCCVLCYVVDFGQTQVDQVNYCDPESVEESNEIEAERTLDNKQKSNAEVVDEEEHQTIFDIDNALK